MKKYTPVIILYFLFSALAFSSAAFAGEVAKIDSAQQLFFIKREFNNGLFASGQNERESQLSDNFDFSEELYTGYTSYQLNNRVWNFLDYKQEAINLNFNVGPFYGNGNVFENSAAGAINANRQLYGLRALLAGSYESRFYYDQKTYTLVQVDGWLRNDVFWQNTSGTRVDTNLVMSDYNNDKFTDRLRYGFHAKAGWGFGRLNPVNHYMVADYILKNFYPRRVFSEAEELQLARKIGEIKQRREPGVERLASAELREVNDFLRSKMMLEATKLTEDDWLMGEFLPRYNGSRVELGPYFNYYNREPDFYYGGFLTYRNESYRSFNWNRNVSLQAKYSHYKQNDWANIEADLGWSYFPNLKNQFDFGLRYIPGVVIHSLKNIEPVRHNFVPYIKYFTQINARSRMNLSFAWRIADGEDFMKSGPEFSLSFYRSSY